jgi:hypothetical protein
MRAARESSCQGGIGSWDLDQHRRHLYHKRLSEGLGHSRKLQGKEVHFQRLHCIEELQVGILQACTEGSSGGCWKEGNVSGCIARLQLDQHLLAKWEEKWAWAL